MATTVKTYNNNNTWIAPPGVTSVNAEAWAGGGAGAGTNVNGAAAGGGGGAYSRNNITPTVGTSYAITVGLGAVSAAAANNGGNSSVSTLVVAQGGVGVANNGRVGGLGGANSVGTGDFKKSGGNGSANGTNLGGGGGAAGSNTADGAVGAVTAGGVGAGGGGSGGAGATTGSAVGSPGVAPGGGGGGSTRNSATNRAGGTGGLGSVKLTYTTPLMSALTDVFPGVAFSATKWNNVSVSGGTVSVSGKQLTLTPAVSTPNTEAQLQSIEFYDLTGNYAQVEVDQVASQNANTLLILAINTSGNQYAMQQQSGTLTANYTVAGVGHSVATATYNAVTHKWWRIRESGGTVFYDYSADGVVWTNLGSVTIVTSGLAVTSLQAYPTVLDASSDAAPGSAKFSNFNVVRAIKTFTADGLIPAKTETQVDDWSSGTINGSKWNNWSSGHASIVSNQLTITSAVIGSNAYYGVDSAIGGDHVYDLTGSYVQNQLISVGNTAIPSWEVYPVELINQVTSDALRMFVTGFSGSVLIICRYTITGVNTDHSFAYDANVHKWFRIRESGGTTFWDYSTDGVTWTNLFNVANPISGITNLRIGQTVGNWQNELAATSATFDNFNVVRTNKTFTTDGIMLVTGNTKTFTTDGIMLVITTKTVTTDGIILATTPKTFTTDGIIKVLNNTFTFTADGIIKVTTTFTFTTDGIIKVLNNIKTFTTDGVMLVQGNIKTFTTDGIVLVTTLKTVTTDGIILVTTLKTFTADGVMLATATKTFTIDGVILVTTTKTFTADGMIVVTALKTFTTDGVITILTQFLVDNFDAGYNSAKWNQGTQGGSLAFINNRVEFTSSLASSYNQVSSVNKYDLRSSYIHAQLINAGDQTIPSLEAIIYAWDSQINSKVWWAIGDGVNIAVYKSVSGGAPIQLATGVYDSTIHKWFKIRESSGTTYFDYSTDGVIWTNFFSVANIFTPNSIEVAIQQGTWQTETKTSTVIWDNFNVVRTNLTLTADGIIKVLNNTFTFTTDGIIKATTPKTFTVDGVILATTTKTFTADGIIFATNTKTFTTDGIIFAKNSKTFTVDGIITTSGTTKTFTADGIIAVRVNFIGNPSFESNAVYWDTAATAGDVTGLIQSNQDTTHVLFGTYAARAQQKFSSSTYPATGQYYLNTYDPITLVAGHMYTFSIYVYIPAGSPLTSIQAGFRDYNSFSTIEYPRFPVIAGQWNRLVVSHIAQAGEVCRLIVADPNTSSNFTGTTEFWVDGGLLEVDYKAVKPHNQMGVSCHLNGVGNTELGTQLALMAAAGVKYIRYDFTMDQIELVQGVYDFSTYDNITTQAEAYGIKTIALMAQFNVPAWALDPTTGANYPTAAFYQDFCQKVAAHYGDRILLYELGNEPNIQAFWASGADPIAYTALLKAGYLGVKTGNRNAKTISAGLGNVSGDVSSGIAGPGHNYNTTDFLSGMYANGAQGYFDYFGIHPYSQPNPPDFSIIDSCVSIMNANGDSGKQVMITELGWHTSTAVNNVSQNNQAIYIQQAFEKILYQGYQYIPILCIYDFKDDGTDITNSEDNFGLIKNDLTTVKTAYTSYQLQAFTFVGDYFDGASPNSVWEGTAHQSVSYQLVLTTYATFTADGIIFATTNKTFTTDGIIFATNTKTFTADGIIKVTTLVPFTVDGIVKVVNNTKSFTADGVILTTTLKTVTADGIVLATSSKTITTDGIIFATNTQIVTADGIVISSGARKTFTVDGIIFATNIFTVTTDGIILVPNNLKTFTVDGIVKVITTQTFTTDGIIVTSGVTKTITVDGIIFATNTKTFTVDGIVKATTSFFVTADGIVKAINLQTFTADGLIRVTNTKTVTVDGIIDTEGVAKTFTVDGIIFVTSTTSFMVDGIVTSGTTFLYTITLDGLITTQGAPGGRTDEGGWDGKQSVGLFNPREMPKGLYTGISQIHDQDETPRLVNKELELLDTLIGGSIE